MLGLNPMIEIRLADFSKFPAGRDEDDGPFNGTKFRREVLVPAITKALATSGEIVEVCLDGVLSFGSSFLEEAFGGLVRVERLDPRAVARVIQVRASRPVYQTYKRQIEKHLKEAASA